jgi:cell division protein FtsW (lipid II flippase)
MFLATGLTAAIGFQVSINAAVTLGLMPTKGLTLPFLSYGGTSMVVNAVAVGILLNIGAAPVTADTSKSARAAKSRFSRRRRLGASRAF